jgi:hypothetical protein
MDFGARILERPGDGRTDAAAAGADDDRRETREVVD